MVVFAWVPGTIAHALVNVKYGPVDLVRQSETILRVGLGIVGDGGTLDLQTVWAGNDAMLQRAVQHILADSRADVPVVADVYEALSDKPQEGPLNVTWESAGVDQSRHLAVIKPTQLEIPGGGK